MDITHHTAIVPASFGAARPSALKGILKVVSKVEAAFPDSRIQPAFTSRFVRRAWRKRLNDPGWATDHPDIPETVYHVKGPLSTIADLEEEGYKTIVVQSLHVYAGEEYINLKSCIEGLNSIKTVKPKQRYFDKLILGRPALGEPGIKRYYGDDIDAAVSALEQDAAAARAENRALVYMGHGNEFYSSGAYVELQARMRRAWPGLPVFVGVVEGFPGLDVVLAGLGHIKAKKVLLVPLLLVAGHHAVEDMAGQKEESWKSIMENEGYGVKSMIRGLGELDSWADIYIRHIREAMDDHGIV